ncbi:MFS monocarboxylate transporter [Rhodotorula toruloides]|uniref:MFS monocarboxylate transporter n=1 Tax=Rhodotorula toruloides TaxID=5286 RepID=A0A511KBB3_RHOTO|nr:MFS monocarboxylate transporter [Rhodotorula toruloides]
MRRTLRPIDIDTITPVPPSPAHSRPSTPSPLKPPGSSYPPSEIALSIDNGLLATDTTRQSRLRSLNWGYSYSFATILVYLQSSPPWSSSSLSALSAIGSCQIGIQFCLSPVVVIVFRRYPDWVKTSLWISLVVNCGSMLLSSWATRVWQLILLQGVICGATGAILYTPVWIWLIEWFVERRGLAGGIIWSGTGIGGFVFPFLFSGLLSKVGFAWVVRVWSLITAVVFAFAVYIVKPRIPPPKVRKGERGPWPAFPWKLLIDPIFAIASLFASLSTFPVSLYLATYASFLTTSTFAAEIVVGIYNIAASVGCTALGYVSDWSYTSATILCGVLGTIIALFAWGWSDTLAKTYGFAVLFGFSSQMIVAWSGATRDVAGQDPYAAALVYCLLSVVRGVASMVMPLVSQKLYNPAQKGDASSWGRFGFSRMIIFVGVTAFVSAVAGVALEFFRRKHKKA